jgi:hypothetical protein
MSTNYQNIRIHAQSILKFIKIQQFHHKCTFKATINQNNIS